MTGARRNSPLLRTIEVQSLLAASTDKSPVGKGTNGTSPHLLYKYPARFSPRFAAAAIRLISSSNDVILDPFMGSGTTVIEAMRHNRRSIGIDINPISGFVVDSLIKNSRARNLDAYFSWFRAQLFRNAQNINARKLAESFPTSNLDLRRTWRHMRLISSLVSAGDLKSPTYDRLTRQIVLKASQWAFDVTTAPPSFSAFVESLNRSAVDVLTTCRVFAEFMDEEWGSCWRSSLPKIEIGRSTEVIERKLKHLAGKVDAIVTSPPYPGVHVLYGRWQIGGRRETDLPHWIIGSSTQLREADYTLHARRDEDGASYFEQLHETMVSSRQLIKDGGYMIQMVGFKNPRKQLPAYLESVQEAGFKEVTSKRLQTRRDGRLWRDVPGRRWYANMQGSAISTRSEVVLLFRAV